MKGMKGNGGNMKGGLWPPAGGEVEAGAPADLGWLSAVVGWPPAVGGWVPAAAWPPAGA